MQQDCFVVLALEPHTNRDAENKDAAERQQAVNSTEPELLCCLAHPLLPG